MYFVGREKETKRIVRALERGNNVILMGKYGIGRTALIKHIASITQDGWRFVFVDFSQTSGKVCHHLLTALMPKKRYEQGRKYRRYKSSRFLIANIDGKDKRKHGIVFDNVGKLTRQKLTFIRYLAWEKRFQFIAIVETFLPENDLFLLRAEPMPADVIALPYLSDKDVCEFFRIISNKRGFGWSGDHIKMLVEITRGYPLGMREMVERESARQMKAGDSIC